MRSFTSLDGGVFETAVLFPEETLAPLHVLDPGDLAPELPSMDDDWFRLYHRPGEDPGDVATEVWVEVHETCSHSSCRYRPDEPCPWHQPGCECSLGACQC